MVKKSPYLYNTRNFLPYLMWDITVTPYVLIVPYEIVEPNRQTPLAKQTPRLGLGINSDAILTNRSKLCRYYLLWAQRTLMALKHIYLVKKSSYLHSSKNFFPCLMWGITITNPPYKHNVLVMSHGIIGPNRQTKLKGLNKALTSRSRINFDTICNNLFTTV